MSRRIEYFDAAGLRKDGRRPLELRDLAVTIGAGMKRIPHAAPLPQAVQPDDHSAPPAAAAAAAAPAAATAVAVDHVASSASSTADGCAELVSGGTHVRALVFGPRQAALRDARPDAAALTCNVTALRRRGGGAARRSRNAELSALVVETVAPVVILAQYPMSAIHIQVDVLQSDGDEEAACINAASIALADACIAMRDIVVAAQVCFLDGKHVVVDPTFEELRSGCPRWLEAVFAHTPTALALLHEEGRYRADQEESAKDALHAACSTACAALATRVLDAVREHTNARLAVLEGH